MEAALQLLSQLSIISIDHVNGLVALSSIGLAAFAIYTVSSVSK